MRRLAYYCSGHGYGHATRVSALALALLAAKKKPILFIVTSAPKHLFGTCFENGAVYRFSEIDPVIVQPSPYEIDRRASIDILREFMSHRDAKLKEEVSFLKREGVDCVLSDAAFLACAAAHASSIPCVLITNFTFDSVYSYLSAITTSAALGEYNTPEVTADEIEPLVQIMFDGYQMSQLLILLPGYIPIPSFFPTPPLPATNWIRGTTGEFSDDILRCFSSMDQPARKSESLTEQFGSASLAISAPRPVIHSSLLVRPPSADIYCRAGRKRFLTSLGLPSHFHDRRILAVSFGGHFFSKPSSIPIGSSIGMRATVHKPEEIVFTPQQSVPCSQRPTGSMQSPDGPHMYNANPPFTADTKSLGLITNDTVSLPPGGCRYLPSDDWIAIICGVFADFEDANLPRNFYKAPPNIYMPDLTACADVMLGKLGYGTVSECLSCGTPLVYVPRPLFIEEHGLKRLLLEEGIGIELPQANFELGDWSSCIEEAVRRSQSKQIVTSKETPTGRDHFIQAPYDLARRLYTWLDSNALY